MKRNSLKTTKAVTVRLSKPDYINLLDMAEQQNSSVADIMRSAWREYQEKESDSNEREQQTQELKSYIFECLSLTKGWDPAQKQKAIQRLAQRLSKSSEVQ